MGRDQAPGAGGAGGVRRVRFGVFRAEAGVSTISTVRESLFDLSLGAFAAIGLPVTFCSSFAALIYVVRRATTERVGEAINVGTAVGLVLGILLATVVFVNGS